MRILFNGLNKNKFVLFNELNKSVFLFVEKINIYNYG